MKKKIKLSLIGGALMSTSLLTSNISHAEITEGYYRGKIQGKRNLVEIFIQSVPVVDRFYKEDSDETNQAVTPVMDLKETYALMIIHDHSYPSFDSNAIVFSIEEYEDNTQAWRMLVQADQDDPTFSPLKSHNNEEIFSDEESKRIHALALPKDLEIAYEATSLHVKNRRERLEISSTSQTVDCPNQIIVKKTNYNYASWSAFPTTDIAVRDFAIKSNANNQFLISNSSLHRKSDGSFYRTLSGFFYFISSAEEHFKESGRFQLEERFPGFGILRRKEFNEEAIQTGINHQEKISGFLVYIKRKRRKNEIRLIDARYDQGLLCGRTTTRLKQRSIY
ncbi:MAG: hypothetical protein CL678_18870 [Bdellovibrionaceae bacterium]|nr:hypothetical protein [Pseudobdellovibrionaceae bacterium]|tara:strand:- start:4382 stop:5389 length:1008 start_codon:yes stop_codon:yes gene_type:complete